MKKTVRTLMRAACGTRGQSTLEYLLIVSAFAALVVGLAALWRTAQAGKLQEIAIAATSHSAAEGVVAALKDVLGY